MLQNIAPQPAVPERTMTPQALLRERYEEVSTLPVPAGIREELRVIVERRELTPGELIATLKKVPAFQFLFEQDSRILEGYSIEEHTSMVLRQFERYFGHVTTEPVVSRAALRLALALHDIGKPLPDEKRNQHEATEAVIQRFSKLLPLEEFEYQRVLSVVRNDVIGRVVVAAITKQATIPERREIAEASVWKLSRSSG